MLFDVLSIIGPLITFAAPVHTNMESIILQVSALRQGKCYQHFLCIVGCARHCTSHYHTLGYFNSVCTSIRLWKMNGCVNMISFILIKGWTIHLNPVHSRGTSALMLNLISNYMVRLCGELRAAVLVICEAQTPAINWSKS